MSKLLAEIKQRFFKEPTNPRLVQEDKPALAQNNQDTKCHTFIEFAPCSMEIKSVNTYTESGVLNCDPANVLYVPSYGLRSHWESFIEEIIGRYERVKKVEPYIQEAVDRLIGDPEEVAKKYNNDEVIKFKNELIDRLNNSIDRYRGGNLAGRDYPDIETFCVDDVYEMIDSVFNNVHTVDSSVYDIDLPEASRKCKERIGFSFYEDYMKIKDSIKDISKDMRDATKEERETIDKHIKEISESTGYNFWDALKESKEKKRKESIKYMHPGIPDIPNEETSNNNGYIIIYKENSMKANGIVKLTNQDVVRSILSIYNGEDVFVVPSCLEPSITDDNEFEFHYIGNYSDTAKTEWENFNKELEFRKTNINMKNGNFEIINTDELILTELREIKEEIKKINDSRHENSEEDLIKICEKLMSDDINKNIEEAIAKAEYNPLMTAISTEQMEKQLNELCPRVKSVFEEAGRTISEFTKIYSKPKLDISPAKADIIKQTLFGEERIPSEDIISMDNLIKKQYPDITDTMKLDKIMPEVCKDVFDISVK